MSKIPRSFFCRDTEIVAREMLGLHLVHRVHGKKISGMIVETEAYVGAYDKACHGYKNRRTERTEVMFSPGGSVYVFLIYGMHHCFNIVTGNKEEPTAVLVRALQPVDGIDQMIRARMGKKNRALADSQPSFEKKNRALVANQSNKRNNEKTATSNKIHQPLSLSQLKNLTNGPGKLCQALMIDRSHSGKSIVSPDLYLETGSHLVKPSEIVSSARIGVDYAEECARWPLRFHLKDNPFVSVP